MAEMEFELKIVVKGSSLVEIDDLLAKAVGERLMTRIQRSQSTVGAVFSSPSALPDGLSLKVNQAVDQKIQDTQLEMPSVPNIEKKADGENKKAKKSAKVAEIAKEIGQTLQQIVDNPPQKEMAAAPQKEMTREDAVKALSEVNAKFGIDKARDILTTFQVKRLGELEPSHIPKFVAHCTAVLQ